MSDNTVQDLSKKIYNSRLRIFKNNPFFGVFLSTLSFSLDTQTKTFATDGNKIYYNENYLKSLNDFEIDLTILHSIMHIVLQHPYRYNNEFDNTLFHLACDIVVNSNIMQSLNRNDDLYIHGRMLKHRCPNGDEGYLHTAEEVYEMLVKVEQKLKKKEQKNHQKPDSQIDDIQADDEMTIDAPEYTVEELHITTSYDGKLYLREESLGDYVMGKGWFPFNNGFSMQTSLYPVAFTSDKIKNLGLPKELVEVEYLVQKELVGVPWYIDETQADFWFQNESQAIEKNKKLNKYQIECYPFYIDQSPLLNELKNTSFSDSVITQEEKIYAKYVYKNYLNVEPVIKKYMLNFFSKANIDINDSDLVIKLRNMVATTFKYDAKYKTWPANKDMVLYFMDEVKKGVCLQFASCLTLLLRSLSIPARIVLGYAGDVNKDEKNIFYLENGHAWVEYYLDGTGWITIDPTPVVASRGGSDGNGKNSSDGESESNSNSKGNGDNKKEDKSSLGQSIDENKKWEKNHDEKENKMKQDEIEQKILDAYENLKNNGYGNIPNSLEILVKKLKTPILDWRVLLYDFIEENFVDYSFCPPDTRFSEADFVLPGFNVLDEKVQDILFMVDVSGSMSLTDVENCFSEIQGALSQFSGKLSGTIGFFDTEIHETYPIEEDTDLLKIMPHGWGGTSFQAVFDYVKNLDEPPKSIIILSDGDCEYPEESESIGIPVLWIINNNLITPPWGKTIRLIREGDDKNV